MISLLEQASEKRAEAARLIDKLFGSWSPHLVRYAYLATSSREVAEDLVQEVFLSLYRELAAGRQIDNVRGYTLNAVRRQVARHERDRHRHREDFLDYHALDLLPGADMRPDSPVPDDINGRLSVLSRREEEVILLRMQAMKYREIGSQLGISSKTVGTLLTRAIQKLRRVSPEGKFGLGSAADNALETLQ